MSKTLKVIAALLACMLFFSALTGCAAAQRPPGPEPAAPDKSVMQLPGAAPSAAEKPPSESGILKEKARGYLDALGCPSAGVYDNLLGLSITSIEKAGGDYKISWECSNPGAAGNELLIFTLMHFFDPDDFSNNYQAFETAADGRMVYDFGAGDKITYTTFRIDFEPKSKVVFLFFEGVNESNSAPPEVYTQPLFFTLILGDEPMVLESTPRLAKGIFDAYLPGTAGTGGTVTADAPLILTAYGNTYIIDAVFGGTDENGHFTVTVSGSGFDTIPMIGGELVLPVECTIISGGLEYTAATVDIYLDAVIFGFDVSAEPDSIVIYPGDDPADRYFYLPGAETKDTDGFQPLV